MMFCFLVKDFYERINVFEGDFYVFENGWYFGIIVFEMVWDK